eukprot:CAMPEP_0198657362 /NCGR_PEP_ID=MMETSP1467-20131203/14531_1 /TAXON_ID=1462469 /ORGANISM="unid. sp., Strain CCMP2135" /LENGTH=55 /DNA_ID=CAMNT_0044393527 /DNA_START=12 /DNA_END=175 /DNA_ORIENTATION=+
MAPKLVYFDVRSWMLLGGRGQRQRVTACRTSQQQNATLFLGARPGGADSVLLRGG